MRRRRYKRLSMAHVYRACRYIFRVMGVWGICLGIVIGDLRFEYLEREYIQEQRREERRVLKSAQERELQKGA